MHLKIQNGTVSHSDSSLCTTCRLATIVRGRTLDEEIVQCHAIGMRGTRVTFTVTYCTSYCDARLPSYAQMMEEAWILQPASKRKPAGFIRAADLPEEDISNLLVDMHKRLDDDR
jgi:hypothetical protein